MPAREPDDKSENDHDEEGTLSPAELETRNRDRAQGVYVEAHDGAELTIVDGGETHVHHGSDGIDFSGLLEDHYDKIDSLLKMLLVLAGLLVLALLLWRLKILGTALKIMELLLSQIPSP